jgi:hypothetical protein
MIKWFYFISGYSSLRAGIWFFVKTFENHGSISSMGIVNFLITMVINLKNRAFEFLITMVIKLKNRAFDF